MEKSNAPYLSVSSLIAYVSLCDPEEAYVIFDEARLGNKVAQYIVGAALIRFAIIELGQI